jgi:ERCC4-type nuclease
VIVVDTREQNPFDFSGFEGRFSGVERKALKLGDYSISGLEDICVVERRVPGAPHIPSFGMCGR